VCATKWQEVPQRGECALALGEPHVAIEPLEQFLRGQEERTAAPADLARANLWLGRARAERREFEAAESCFVAVTEISDGPLAAEAQFRIGACRRDGGDLRGAADAFVKLPILYGDPTWVRAGLLAAGVTSRALDQPDKPARFFRELVERHAGSDEARAAAEQLQDRR
jgi:TolA-binding protein